jgi:ribose transport system substrate-binding protein
MFRKTKKHLLSIIGVIVISLSLLTACGTTTATSDTKSPNKTFKVGYSIDTIATPYNAKAYEQMKAEWKKHPEVTLYTTEAEAKSIKQVSDIEDLISKGVDLLIVKPRDEKTLAVPLAKAYKQGIKVVLIDRVVDSEDYSTAIVTDNAETGRVSAEYLAKVLGGKGNILLAEGTPGASSYLERTQAFMETLKKYPDMKVISQQPSNAKRDDGKTLMENWLQAYGDKINAVHSNADEITMGIVQAIQQAGKTGKIKVTSITGLQEAVKAVKDGQIDQVASITNGVKKGVDVSWKLLNGEKVPKKIVVPTTLVTKDNADKYYAPDKYLIDEVVDN